MLIDTHSHLNDERLEPLADDIALNMSNDNLEALINVGYDRPSSEKAVQQAEKYADVYALVGIHPHDAKNATQDDYLRFCELAKCEKVVGIGEIGLDFYYDLSERDIQERVFLEEMELAHFLKLPMSFHIRDAYDLTLKLFKEHKNLLEYGGVLHCYAGSLEQLKEFRKLDLYYAFGGVITFKNAKKEGIVQAVPTDRLLLETDCPYMTPVPYRGTTNYPKYVNLVAEKVKEFLPDLDVENVTATNAKRLFSKIK